MPARSRVSKCFSGVEISQVHSSRFDCLTYVAGMDIIDGESLEGDRRTKNVVAIRGKLILRKLGPCH